MSVFAGMKFNSKWKYRCSECVIGDLRNVVKD